MLLELSGKYTKDKLTRDEAKVLAKLVLPIAKKHVTRVAIAGSLRRNQPVVGDLDFVVTDADLGPILLDLTIKLDAKAAPRVGDHVMTVLIPFGKKKIQVEFVAVKDKSFGAAMIHSTGSADFNVGLRSMAKGMGLLLNQHGLWNGTKFVAGKTEEDVFKAMGMDFVPPLERNVVGDFGSVRDKYQRKVVKPTIKIPPKGKRWKVRSSTTNETYIVTYTPLDPHQKWSCQCKGFEFRNYCKHIEAVRQKRGL